MVKKINWKKQPWLKLNTVQLLEKNELYNIILIEFTHTNYNTMYGIIVKNYFVFKNINYEDVLNTYNAIICALSI